MIDPERTPRVLVTGGAGFIGSWLVETLLARGHQVEVLDDLSTGVREHVPPQARFTLGDVLDRDGLGACLQRADAVFHLAGVVGMRLAHAHKQRSYDVAVRSTEYLLEGSDCPVVLMSSSAVYGMTDGRAVAEDEQITDALVRRYDGGSVGYALGKWHMEALGAQAAASRPVLMVRPFNVVGPRQTGQYGMVVPTFAKLALAGQVMEIHDDGLQGRSFGHVHTMVDALVRLAATPAAFEPGANVFNLGADTLTTILDLARAVSRHANVPEQWVFRPYDDVFPGRSDVRARRPDTGALHRAIGAVDWPGLDVIVADVMAHLRQAQVH